MVNPAAAPAIVVISDDPRVGHALVSYLSTSTALLIQGPVHWENLNGGVRAAVAVCDLDRTDLSAALDQLGAMSRDSSLKVIALSTSPEARRQALERGALYAADKSAEMDQLAERIRSAANPSD